MLTSYGWLVWTEGRLAMWMDDAVVPLEGPGVVSREAAALCGFSVGHRWLLVLPGPRAPAIWWSEDGLRWHAFADLPVHGPTIDQVGFHPRAGLVTVVHEQTLFVGREGAWSSIDLPVGASWVGASADGGWWAIGSRSAQCLRGAVREVAVWRRPAEADTWQEVPVSLSWWDAWLTREMGGFEKLKGVDANGEPVVFASECTWFLDDPSWFLFARLPSGRFSVKRLAWRRLVNLDRDGQGRPLAFTDDGEVWRWEGRKWVSLGFATSLAISLVQAGLLGKPTIHMALVDQEAVATAVLWQRGQRSNQVALQTKDGGRNWSILDVVRTIEPRMIIGGWVRKI